MKSAGVLISIARGPRVLRASVAATLFVLFAGALAAAQSGPDTAATATWKTAASSAAAAPSNMVPTPPDMDASQPGAAEIPAAADASSQQSSPNPVGSQPSTDSQQSNDSSEIARYQEEQSGMPPEQLRSLQEFDSEGELSTPFGMQLREAKRTLKSGEDADGLLITAVAKGSPAAAAGLRAYTHTVHDAIAAAAMVGAVFSGGLSVVVIPALDYMQVGESYDMIIGVDGSRVTNFLDFQDRMRDLQPGEIVYLSILRDGKRLQVTIPVTSATIQASN
jgi:PDZ domain